MPGISELVDELCAALVGFDPALWSGADCADLAEQLARGAKSCAAASARAAGRAADAGAYRSRGDATAPDWLARVNGSSAGAARTVLGTVALLREGCSATRAALAAGEVSLAQAAEITALPEHEAELLALARRSGLRAVRDTARKRRLAGIEPDELHARQHAAREFRHWKDELGMIRFRGALPPAAGVAFANRLDAQTDREWRAARRDGRDDPRPALAADAFVRLVSETGVAGKARAADVVFVVDTRAYQRGHAHPGEPCHIIGGGPVPVAAVLDEIDDAFLKVVLHDGVNIQTVAHYGRHRSAELQTALALGAAPAFEGVTCAEPGCDRIYGLQWDHVDPHANGGLTSLGNIQPLCTPHHCDKTERDRKAGLLTSKGPAP